MQSETHMIELDGERVEETDLLESHDCHPITDARARIGRLADEVRITGRPALLTRHGRPAVAVVSAEDAMRLLALRRAQARRGLEAARVAREAGGQDVPIEQALSALEEEATDKVPHQLYIQMHREFGADKEAAAREDDGEDEAHEGPGEQSDAV